LLRNICCEGSEEEIELVFNGFGEAPLFDVIERKLAASDPDCLEQASIPWTGVMIDRRQLTIDCFSIQLMFVLYNICLGNEKHREAVLSRPEVCKGIMKALVRSIGRSQILQECSMTNVYSRAKALSSRFLQLAASPIWSRRTIVIVVSRPLIAFHSRLSSDR
jgi:hypothetical protein